MFIKYSREIKFEIYWFQSVLYYVSVLTTYSVNIKMYRTVIHVTNIYVKYVLPILWTYISIYKHVVCDPDLGQEAIFRWRQTSILYDDFTIDMFILILVNHYNATCHNCYTDLCFLFYTNLYFWLLGSQDKPGLWLKKTVIDWKCLWQDLSGDGNSKLEDLRTGW